MSRPKRYASFKEYRKLWRKENPDKVALQNLRTTKNRRARSYRIGYDISLERYNAMLIEQNNKCAICKRNKSEFKNRLAVDHDHSTKVIRGLLCMPCNTKLATIEDSLFLLEAKAYLGRNFNALSI